MPLSSPTGLTRTRTLERALARADRQLARGAHRSQQMTYARLALALTSAAIIIVLFRMEQYVAGNLAVAAAISLFLLVAHYHNRLEQGMHRWRLWRDIKRTHLARLRHDWDAIPPREHAAPTNHAYAQDLDLVGPRSLLRLIDTTVSSTGRERLTQWLLTQPDDRAAWESRQALVRSLTGRTRLRDRLVLESRLVDGQELDGARLRAVLTTPAGWPSLPTWLAIESGVALTTLGLLVLRLSGIHGFAETLGHYWLLSFFIYAGLFLWSDRSDHAFEHALSLEGELERLSAVLHVLERQGAVAPPSQPGNEPDALTTLCRRLQDPSQAPSSSMRQASRIVAGLSVRANPLIHIAANLPGPWDLYFTWRLMHLQTRIAAQVPGWLDILAEMEAASALATFAWLHPAYSWPRLQQPSQKPMAQRPALEAVSLGHPLIPAEVRVTNDVALDGVGHILLVTGSNMSGKSTFLRTIGVNICLAQSGAPVCATRLSWQWVRLETCLRVADSIDAGLSHFYAEVKRLKGILTAAERRDPAPVLFLIDEIFRGTNNRERLIGSRAYILALSRTRAFGLVTTHDLELAELADRMPHLANIHFQETVREGTLHFDYRMRPGPCPTTNALRIMELEGLPTDGGDSTRTT